MADLLDSTGLQTKTLSDIVTDLTNGLKEIYGNDINVEQNSPDGQLINIIAQQGVDIRELIMEVYNSFDPDRASGRVLDERVAINNIERLGGTFTIQPVEITVDRTVTLQGLDGDFNDPDGQGYTVQDDAGNEFILIDTVVLTAGTHSKNFRAKEIGRVETIVGTIINPVTIVLGVTDIENTVAPLELGQNEETDVELKIRRGLSVAIVSSGYLDGLRAYLLNLDGVSEAIVFENPTDSIDADGIPAHGIWVIVEGGANTEIAEAIYSKKSYGADMKGDTIVNVTTASGDIFQAKFDRPTAQALHIKFQIQPTISGASFNQTAIKEYIEENLIYNIGSPAETSRITCLILEALEATGGQGVPINVKVSDDSITWVDYLPTPDLDDQWTVSMADIDITEL